MKNHPVRSLTTGKLIRLFGAALLFAAAASLGISSLLARGYLAGLKEREVNILFGAIEAGPLTLAHLNAAAIAQAELSRLLEAPGNVGRLVSAARIEGGDARQFNYATWNSPHPVSKACLARIERPFSYPDMIHPLWVTLELNRCAQLTEAGQTFRSALASVTVICLLMLLSLLIAAMPLIRDFRRTQRLIHGSAGHPGEIGFVPLRELAGLALRSRELEREAALSRMATQVAHDIRSPLGALQVALQDSEFSEGSRALVRGAIHSIRGIAEGLLRDKREKLSVTAEIHKIGEISNQTADGESLAFLLEKVVSQKQIQYRARPEVEITLNLDEEAYPLFARINPIVFERIISNLINNSMEAIAGAGRIQATLTKISSEFAACEIRDSGHGISADLLPLLAKRGVTVGKPGGLGLGLSHARDSIEAIGGSLEIQSSPTGGTRVRLNLPVTTPPDWFLPALKIAAETQVVVIDDDESVGLLWRQRLQKAGLPPGRFHATKSPDELVAWFRENIGTDALYLCDQEFRSHAEVGTELLGRLSISEQAVLVTNRSDEATVLSSCRKQNLPVIPKALLPIVPIRVEAAGPV